MGLVIVSKEKGAIEQLPHVLIQLEAVKKQLP